MHVSTHTVSLPSIELIIVTVNKQLNDKERVAAALENNALLNVVEQCLRPPNAS